MGFNLEVNNNHIQPRSKRQNPSLSLKCLFSPLPSCQFARDTLCGHVKVVSTFNQGQNVKIPRLALSVYPRPPPPPPSCHFARDTPCGHVKVVSPLSAVRPCIMPGIMESALFRSEIKYGNHNVLEKERGSWLTNRTILFP